MEFLSIEELKRLANKKFQIVISNNSKVKQLYLKLKIARLKRELEETEKQLIWEVLKNGR